MYDVPDSAPHLYARLRKEICWKRAVMVNRSVYLIDWGARAEILKIIADAEKETNEKAEISIMPFDESGEPELKEMAERAMLRMMGEMRERLRRRLESAREKVEQDRDVVEPEKEILIRQRRVLRDVKRQLSDAEGLALVFALTDEIKIAFESTKKAFVTEMESAQEKKEKLKLEQRRAKQAEAKAAGGSPEV